MASTKKNITHLIKIGLFANTFEWYEFSVFGYLSFIIGKLFFTSDSDIAELLKVFTLFAISYFIRPLGSVFFGVLGDIQGRRQALQLSLMLMTVPTVFIGLLPTYTQAGSVATFSLIVLRMIQGFAMGGELPSTACYVFESSPPEKRSILCSTVGTATKIGLLLGSGMTYILMRLFDEASLLAWAWRIPFLLGAPLTLFISYIRHSIEETKIFNHESCANKTFLKQVYSILPALIQAIMICTFLNVGFPILTLWMPIYLNYFLNIPANTAYLLNTLTLCAMVPMCFGSGYIAQKIGDKNLFAGSTIMTMLLIVPIFKGLQLYTDFQSLLCLHVLFAALVSVTQGTFVEIICRLFKTEHRSLGISLSFIIPASLVGGTVPLLCSHMVYQYNWLMFPAIYILLSGFIGLPAILKLKNEN